MSPSTLINEARAAAGHAYCPYSGFRVGAAVLSRDGTVFTGCNVENASYNLGICAERVALAGAIAAGVRPGEFDAIAIACIDAPESAVDGERMPCGGCRQWLQELAPEARIHIDGIPESLEQPWTIADLLPRAFRLPASD